LFGLFKKKKGKEFAPSVDEKRQAIVDALPPAKQELKHLIPEIKNYTPVGDLVWQALVNADDAELKSLLLGKVIPNVPPELAQKIKDIGKRSAWADYDHLRENGLVHLQNKRSFVGFGRFDLGGVDTLLEFDGEGHLATIAPTGAGKGQGHIIPALYDYIGPVFVLDPKGENYRETAWRRRWFGNVFKWAPFEEETDTFNPLDYIKGYDDARVLANLIVVTAGKSDPFWDRSAIDLLVGLVLYVKSSRPPELQNMREVCRLLAPSKVEYEEFLDALKEVGDERLTETSNILSDQPENVRMGIFQTLRSHVDVWRSDEITRATSLTTEDFDPSNIMDRQALTDVSVEMGVDDEDIGPSVIPVTAPDGSEGQGFIRGQSDSVFLIVPQDKIASYSGVLRVVVGMFINEITKYVAGREAVQEPGERRSYTPMMFLLDELPQLGYMDIIENSIVIARSSRMRFWLFAQALDQLIELYPKAKTMLSNCRLKMFFNLADLHTARYVSEYLGEATDLFGQKNEVLTPQELMGPNYKNTQIVIPQGMSPIKARLRLKYEDENLKMVDLRFRDFWIDSDDRKNMAGRLS